VLARWEAKVELTEPTPNSSSLRPPKRYDATRWTSLLYPAEIVGGHGLEHVTVRYLGDDDGEVYTVHKLDVGLAPDRGEPDDAERKRQRKARKKRDEERKKRAEAKSSAAGTAHDFVDSVDEPRLPTAVETLLADNVDVGWDVTDPSLCLGPRSPAMTASAYPCAADNRKRALGVSPPICEQPQAKQPKVGTTTSASSGVIRDSCPNMPLGGAAHPHADTPELVRSGAKPLLGVGSSGSAGGGGGHAGGHGGGGDKATKEYGDEAYRDGTVKLQQSGKSLLLKIDTAKLSKIKAAEDAALKVKVTDKIAKSDKWRRKQEYEIFYADVRGERRKVPQHRCASASVKLNDTLLKILKPLIDGPDFIDFVCPIADFMSPLYLNVLHGQGLKPMDLQSMDHKAKREGYRSSAEFRADAMQIQTACVAYNEHENGRLSWLLPIVQQLLDTINQELGRHADAIGDFDAALMHERAFHDEGAVVRRRDRQRRR